MGTKAQQKWIAKLMGFNFTIEYKKRKENVVVDALSRSCDPLVVEQAMLAMITLPNPLTYGWMS